MRSWTHRVSDTVAPWPTFVFNVYGRARQESPGIKLGVSVDHPISLSGSGLSGQCGMYACVLVVVTWNLVLEGGTTEG